jgi:hypothetical protein
MDPRSSVRLEPGIDVILATVWIEQGEVVQITAAGRRDAVPPGRPHIAAGRTSEPDDEQHQWRAWPDKNPIGAIRTVNTIRGGFIAVPYYLVQLEVNYPISDQLQGGTLRLESVLVTNTSSQSFDVICLMQAYQQATSVEQTVTLTTRTTTTTTRLSPTGPPPKDGILKWVKDVGLEVAWVGIEN